MEFKRVTTEFHSKSAASEKKLTTEETERTEEGLE